MPALIDPHQALVYFYVCCFLSFFQSWTGEFTQSSALGSMIEASAPVLRRNLGMPRRTGWFRFSPEPSGSLRSRLIFLVLATMAPLLIFAAAMVARLAHEERATFERGVTERTRALLTALDAELGSSVTVLEALATWEHFDGNDLGSFYEDATRVLNSQPTWITIRLAFPTGEQLIDLLYPFGARLPAVAEAPSFEQVLRTRKPTVGQLSQEPSVNQRAFSVRVPVIRHGDVKYVLTAIVDPQGVSALLVSQRLPATWIGAVLDGNGRFVARTLEPERTMGQLASESLRAAVHRAPEGWSHGRTIEGSDVYTPYNRSEVSGWTVAIDIPAPAVEATFRSSLLYVAFFGLALVALGIAIAWFLSGRTAESIGSLAVMAQDLGLGGRPAANAAMTKGYIPSGVAEIEAVRDTLFTANRLITEHSEERDKVEAQLRAVSERLEMAQAAGNIGSFEKDLVTDEIRWSVSQEKLYGLEPGSFAGTHEDWARRVHPDDIAHVEHAVDRAAQTLKPMMIEFRIIRPDGTVRWVASQAQAFGGDSESGARILGVNIDITERKRAEEALREADRRKDEFLAMLGHELRNPLGIISTSAQLLRRKGPRDATLTELREMILRQAEHMARMLDDLLDISRITRGQISLKKESCDFTEIVRQMTTDHRGAFEESGLRLIAHLPDQPLRVLGDPTRLAEVVGNLLYNANKFTDHGGTVTVRLSEEAGSDAVLSVADTGIGMESQMLGQVFDPFIQADRSIDRSRGGLGLGLALVKGLVELHGGEVRAQSEGLGRGSEFIIRLPLHQQSALPQAEPVEVVERRVSRCRILIVEDNLIAARTMQMYLETVGHRVEVANTGPAGIETARQFHPQIVLCDIGLPGFDGYAVARNLRRQSELNGMCLIAISGYGQDDDQRRAREAGFDLHLSKPVDMESIDAIVEKFEQTGAV
jgi:PAS domain S-box-containing protein